ncbi:hypothetical protein BC829DRAFT_383745 [Chytridium lagenaria]|nr:hypothetical protein BC829DRAFT_383745 [Chytridium lagenaria]
MFCNDLNADPNFLQTAWMLVNDCYRSDIPLLHAPHMIALSSILIAAGLHEKNGQDATLTSAAAPPGLEKWFSELNVNVQELYQIVQELFEHFAVLKELKDEDCTAILAKVNREKVVVESGKTDHGSNFRTKQNT